MTYCITSRRGTSKLLEIVPNPFDLMISIKYVQNKGAIEIVHLSDKGSNNAEVIYILCKNVMNEIETLFLPLAVFTKFVKRIRSFGI